jgi:hypothetical protein
MSMGKPWSIYVLWSTFQNETKPFPICIANAVPAALPELRRNTAGAFEGLVE